MAYWLKLGKSCSPYIEISVRLEERPAGRVFLLNHSILLFCFPLAGHQASHPAALFGESQLRGRQEAHDGVSRDFQIFLHQTHRIDYWSRYDVRRVFGQDFVMKQSEFDQTVAACAVEAVSWFPQPLFLTNVFLDEVQISPQKPVDCRLADQKVHLDEYLGLHLEQISGIK